MRRIVYHEIGSYRSVLADPSRQRYAAWDARIKYADNNSGEMSITIAPDNPEYQALACLTSELVVEDDGVEIWRGRLLEPPRGLRLAAVCVCVCVCVRAYVYTRMYMHVCVHVHMCA